MKLSIINLRWLECTINSEPSAQQWATADSENEQRGRESEEHSWWICM